MRKIFLAVGLLLALTACSAPKMAAETPMTTVVPTMVAPTTVVSATPTSTSEVAVYPAPDRGDSDIETEIIRDVEPETGVRLSIRLVARENNIDRVEICPAEEPDKPFQVFDFSDQEGGAINNLVEAAFYYTVEDMNFDGDLDFRVLRNMGMVNAYYYCFFWDGAEGKFIWYEPLLEVTSPEFDAQRHLVHSWERFGGFGGSNRWYAYEDGALTLLREHVLNLIDPETQTPCVVRDRIDGRLTEVFSCGADNSKGYETFAEYENIDYCTPQYQDRPDT